MPSSSISIHALLAESDFNNGVALVPHQQISIHALLAESDDIKLTDAQYLELFLSTLSLRRATPGSRRRLGRAGHFYPRSPCGERHAAKVGWTLDDNSISIHALLAESDR